MAQWWSRGDGVHGYTSQGKGVLKQQSITVSSCKVKGMIIRKQLHVL